jgi:hypothetical protein
MGNQSGECGKWEILTTAILAFAVAGSNKSGCICKRLRRSMGPPLPPGPLAVAKPAPAATHSMAGSNLFRNSTTLSTMSAVVGSMNSSLRSFANEKCQPCVSRGFGRCIGRCMDKQSPAIGLNSQGNRSEP